MCSKRLVSVTGKTYNLGMMVQLDVESRNLTSLGGWRRKQRKQKELASTPLGSGVCGKSVR